MTLALQETVSFDPQCLNEGSIEVKGIQNSLFPWGQSLSVCYTSQLKSRKKKKPAKKWFALPHLAQKFYTVSRSMA